MRRLAVRAAVAAVAVGLIGSTVAAYLVRRTDGGDPVAWNLATSAPNLVAGRVTYFIETSGVPDVTPQQFADAVRASVQAWEDVPASSIAFEEDPSRDANGKNASDRVNWLGYTGGTLGPLTFAAAYVSVSGDRITDADVVFNPSLDWAVVSPGNPSRADVQGVCTHEWGHCLGLDHVPASQSTMFFAASFGAVSLRSLEVDDAAAVADSYPDPSRDTDFAAVRGRVDVVGTGNDRGVQVTAVDFVTGRPAASNFSGPDGSYDIRGLPPGAYYLVASPIGTQKADGGVYSLYWKSATTAIVPAVRGQDGAADGSTGVLLLDAGEVLEDADIAVAVDDDPLEPNDSTGTATPMAIGRSAAARIEDLNDRDFYAFAGGTGQSVTVLLHARQLGSDLDPRIYLRSPTGLILATSQDISSGFTQPDGADIDCRFVEFTLPVAGTYFVEVEAEESPVASRAEDFFYVLTILPGEGAASPFTSRLDASPAVAPADGAYPVTLTFTPRAVQGGSIAPGAVISFDLVADGDPDGTLAPAPIDMGDGTWTTTITAPAAGGSDAVRALVDGTPVRTATVTWRGVADYAASYFAAAPRRIRFDGASQSTVVLVPRDADGVPFGPGRSVVLSLAGSPDAGVGGTTDRGDGSYAAVVTAGTTPEIAEVGATVDGSDLGGTTPVGVGFPLEPVIDEVLADVGALVDGPPAPPAKSLRKLVKARDLLQAAASLSSPADASAILTAAKGAAVQLEGAAKKGAATGDLPRELAEAAREAAIAAIAAAGPLADTPAEMRALAKADAYVLKGEDFVDAGLDAKAAGKFRSALLQALKVE